MITIESVRLRNFRAVREAYFQPLQKGITGIFGSNGAGKTTILAGVIFALFGTRPPGASIASLRRSGTGKDDECSVSVVFNHMGQQVEVIREIKGSNNRAILNIYVDGIEVTTTSVGAGETWISQRLGIDSAGFLTAFVVRQKELDQLINARPAERKAIIERLAGIETINEALKKARKDENLAKETLESLPGSQHAIEENESAVMLLTTKVEELTNARETAQDKLAKSQANETAAASLVESLRALETALIRDRNQKEVLLESNQSYESTLLRLSYLDTVSDTFDIEDLRAQHQTLSAELASNTHKLHTLQIQNTTAKNKIADTGSALELLNGLIANAVTKPEAEKKLLSGKKTLVNKIEELTTTYSQANTRAQDLQESVEALQHSTECPTCHTHLDNPASLVESMQNMATEYLQQSVKALDERNIAEVELELIEGHLRELATYRDNLAKIEELEVILADAHAQVVPDDETAVLEKTIADLNLKKEEVTELGLRAKNLLSDRALKTQTEATLSANEAKINALSISIADNMKKFSQDKLDKAVANLTSLKNETSHLSSLLNESYSELSGYQSRLAIATNNYKSATEQWKRKQELLEAQEKRALTTELIDKFRRESVASLTPELSENATELISDITNGAYTEIKIDDDFNISVLNSRGDERKVGELSGGEESAVALSLRLAIGLLITGRSPELLWLDEVLTAQDADRRQAMLSTIRGLPFGQIIMINHTQDAADIVDKAITVVPDLKLGSTLKTVSDSEATINSMLDDIEEEDSPF